MQNLVIIALLLTMHLPAGMASSSRTCIIRPIASGKRICWCKANRPGSRWQVYPMLICQLTNR